MPARPLAPLIKPRPIRLTRVIGPRFASSSSTTSSAKPIENNHVTDKPKKMPNDEPSASTVADDPKTGAGTAIEDKGGKDQTSTEKGIPEAKDMGVGSKTGGNWMGGSSDYSG